MILTTDSFLVRDAEPTAVVLDDRIVLLSIRAGSYFDLNRAASEIWKMLAEPCRVGRIFDRLSEMYYVDTETLSRDVTPFLAALAQHRLVRVIK